MYPSLLLVKPVKTRPCLTERLLMGRKESNQTSKKKPAKKVSEYDQEIPQSHTANQTTAP